MPLRWEFKYDISNYIKNHLETYIFSKKKKKQFDTPLPFSRWSFCTVTLRNKKTKTKKMAMVGLYRWPLPFPPTIDFASSKGRFRSLADTTWYGRYGPILAELGRFDANRRESKRKKKVRRGTDEGAIASDSGAAPSQPRPCFPDCYWPDWR